MGNMLDTSGVDRGFEPWLAQTKDYKISICSFSIKHTSLGSYNRDGLTQNQVNGYKWS